MSLRPHDYLARQREMVRSTEESGTFLSQKHLEQYIESGHRVIHQITGDIFDSYRFIPERLLNDLRFFIPENFQGNQS